MNKNYFKITYLSFYETRVWDPCLKASPISNNYWHVTKWIRIIQVIDWKEQFCKRKFVAYSRIARYIKKLVPNQAFKGTIFVIIEKGFKKAKWKPWHTARKKHNFVGKAFLWLHFYSTIWRLRPVIPNQGIAEHKDFAKY